LVTVADMAALAAYCTAYANLADATKTLQEEGEYLVDANGVKRVHPARRVQKDAAQQLKLALAEFGLSPAARARLQIVPPAEAEVDPMAEFLDEDSGSVTGFARKRG
jgi:P27 family predicted phage terminase small subunit